MGVGYRAAVDAAAIFSEADLSGNITYVNKMFCEISGYAADELIGQDHRMLNSGQHPPEFFRNLWRTISQGRVWKGEICNRRKDGSLYWVESTIVPIFDAARQRPESYASIRFDITEKRQLMKALQWRAEHDELTGLPNRSSLFNYIEHAISKIDHNSIKLAICMLDLDGFKLINDRHGHAIGDRILIKAADRLRQVIRCDDILARLGGDEFVVSLHVRNLNDLNKAMKRMLSTLSKTYTIDGIDLSISASAGVTIYPNDSADAETLLRHADQAMYKAKQSGRNRYTLFDISLDKFDKMTFDTVNRVKEALLNGELCLHYQPKVNLNNGVVIGFEALLRWNHPHKGLVPPLDFLPVVEHNELIVEIGEWAINTALTQIDEWAKIGHLWPISVNVGALHFNKSNFPESIKEILANHPNVPPQMLDIEIVESVALENISRVSKHLEQCMGLGVQFSLDDFGTGYSSLSYLKQLPTHAIKIDQSFVQQLPDNESLALVRAIVSLAKSFDREVIAEGVENDDQAELLLSIGCNVAQGYGIAKPMPARQAFEWAVQQNSSQDMRAPYKGR
ncbi:putative bifunctional diguanylate cyclase/phosphodiesterase [Pseudomonas sp. NY15354]|uniref:putative bifunctional diguanylate cyclase/phosphodiesterase n=1 Tax=Pseudomonas sp. NY15354 TaxID=3400351 RepID=UPI003A8C30F1